MDRRLIFLDIDGTLVAMLSTPTPEVRGAIRKARTNGHLVFLCTGRNLPIIGQDILEVGFDGVIASAGAYVEVGGQVLLDQLLPEELVQECLKVFHGLGMFCRLETPEGVYIDPQMLDCCAYGVAMGNGGPEIKTAADYVTDDVDRDGLYRAFEKLGLLSKN